MPRDAAPTYAMASEIGDRLRQHLVAAVDAEGTEDGTVRVVVGLNMAVVNFLWALALALGESPEAMLAMFTEQMRIGLELRQAAPKPDAAPLH